MPSFKWLQQVNDYLAIGGWCAFPLCPAPRTEFQSLTREALSTDDDYTDAMAAWEAARDAWLDEPYDAWVADRDAWVAEDPDNREPEDYPTPPPDPRDPEDFPTAEPTKPAGYDDVEHGSWAQFTAPPGDSADDLPSLYRTKEETALFMAPTGTGKRYSSSWFDAETTGWGQEQLATEEWENGASTSDDITGNEVDPFASFACTPLTSGSIIAPGPTPPPSEPEIIEEEHQECTVTTSKMVERSRSQSGGTEPELKGCPGPFVIGGTIEDVEWWDFTYETSTGLEIASGVTKPDLGERATGKIPATWPDEPEGSQAIALLSFDWPLIGEFGTWAACGHASLPYSRVATATAVKARYRRAIPLLWEQWQERKDAYDAWVAGGSDPDEAVENPGPRRTNYRLVWIEVFIPKPWAEWKLLKDAYDAAVAAHESWEAADPGTRGPEPEIPDEPASEPTPGPSLVAERDWTWGGSEEEPWSGWYVIEVPETEGEVRLFNLGIFCYDTKFGKKPTLEGPEITLA